MKTFKDYLEEAKNKGEYYVEKNENGDYGIYHTDKGEGKEYKSFASKKEADAYCAKMNN